MDARDFCRKPAAKHLPFTPQFVEIAVCADVGADRALRRLAAPYGSANPCEGVAILTKVIAGLDGVVRACARPRIALFLALIAGSLGSFPSPLRAQTVGPRIVEFDPSSDHNASVNGIAVVTEYELRFFAVGRTQPLHVIELGKPTVESDGKIRFNFAALLGGWPVAGVVYEARVAAVGPGGSSQSTISNQFVFGTTAPPPPPTPPTCAYSVSTTSRRVGAGTTTGSVSITAGSGCTWTASSSAGWLTITNRASGSGNGTVNFSVAANSGSTARSATLTVGSATFTLTQSGSCTFVASPTSRGINPAGGTASVTVTAGSGCSWTATRSGSWITITSGSSGSGNGTVNYRVSANRGSSSRTGTLTIAGQPVTITQSGARAPNVPVGLRIVSVR
jgi:Viral BACON domain/Putative binding domain, N-terminal